MKEILYNFDEFKAKVDLEKPLHHSAWRKPLDKDGIYYELTFRVYGVHKGFNHLLIFEWKERLSMLDIPDQYRKSHNAYDDLNLWFQERYRELAEKYGKSMGSTEGRWEE